MSTLRLRVLKRHTSLEVPFEEFFTAELYTRDGKPDMNLSVFDIESHGLVRTHAEFCVSLLHPAPKKKRGGLTLQGCEADFDAVPSPSDDFVFEYARTRHLELRFLRDSELRALAEQIFRERADRECSTSHADVVAYGKSRLASGDEEWQRACEVRQKWGNELRK